MKKIVILKFCFLFILVITIISSNLNCDETKSMATRVDDFIQEYLRILELTAPYDGTNCCCHKGTSDGIKCIMSCECCGDPNCNDGGSGGGSVTWNTEKKFVDDSTSTFYRYHAQYSNSPLGCAFMHLRARYRLENGADIASYNLIKQLHPNGAPGIGDWENSPNTYYFSVYSYMNYYEFEVMSVGGGCNQCYANDPVSMGIIEHTGGSDQHSQTIYEALSKSLDRYSRVKNCYCERYYFSTGVMLSFNLGPSFEHLYAFGIQRSIINPNTLCEGSIIYYATPLGNKYDDRTYGYFNYNQFINKNRSNRYKCLCDRTIQLNNYPYPNWY